MKTCVVRRRFYSTEAINATVDVDLEPGFGIPKAIAVIYVENKIISDWCYIFSVQVTYCYII